MLSWAIRNKSCSTKEEHMRLLWAAASSVAVEQRDTTCHRERKCEKLHITPKGFSKSGMF